MIYFHKC